MMMLTHVRQRGHGTHAKTVLGIGVHLVWMSVNLMTTLLPGTPYVHDHGAPPDDQRAAPARTAFRAFMTSAIENGLLHDAATRAQPALHLNLTPPMLESWKDVWLASLSLDPPSPFETERDDAAYITALLIENALLMFEGAATPRPRDPQDRLQLGAHTLEALYGPLKMAIVHSDLTRALQEASLDVLERRYVDAINAARA